MSSKVRAEDGPATPEPSFDQRLARLEQIVAELEQGKVGLEDAIGRYQEGTELVRRCRALLDGYQKRVEELTDSGAQPYANDPDAR
ncbi:MAG: exodeoxyribonuclease VII small subunit [Planctomycetes bacterium]|nr:exodeoxyribonuclease VII small subunit [Planctomycetota bacterium]